MSSASQLLFGSTQGNLFGFQEILPWTPLELFSDGTKGVWYDATDSSTLLDSAGDPVIVGQNITSVLNKAPTGGDLSSLTANKASVGQDLQGNTFIEFFGKNAVYTADTEGTAGNYKMFQMSAMRHRQVTSLGCPHALRYTGQPAGSSQFFLISETDVVTANGRDSTNGYIAATSINLPSNPYEFIGGFSTDGDTDIVTCYVEDNTTSGSGATYLPDVNANVIYSLGGRGASTDNETSQRYSDADIYETIALVGRLPTETELTEIYNYLRRHFE